MRDFNPEPCGFNPEPCRWTPELARMQQSERAHKLEIDTTVNDVEIKGKGKKLTIIVTPRVRLPDAVQFD